MSALTNVTMTMEAAENPVADPNNAPSDAGLQPGADDPNVGNSDASPPETDQGTSNSDAQPNSDTGVPNSDTGTPNGGNSTDTAGPAPNSDTAPENINTGNSSIVDKGGDKINTLNNIGDSVSHNSTDTGASDPKLPGKDPNGINLPESATNQSTTQQPVLPDITTEGKPEILPVETTTTEKSTTESTSPSTTTESTTAKATTEPIIIEFPNSVKTDPPYAIVTSSSPTNGTVIGPGDKGGSTGAVVIAGSIIGVLVLVILVAILIVWFLRRKKRRSKQIIHMVENPRYKAVEPTITRSSPAAPAPAPHNYRFSRDADIAIGEVRIGKQSNNNLKVSPMFGKKGMLSYSPSGSGSDLSTGTGSRKKRRAPPPPNPFGNPDYYERGTESGNRHSESASDDSEPLKDSNGSDGYEMTTFGTSTFGKGVTPPPKTKQNAPDEPAKEPLLNGNASKEPKRSGDYSSSSSSSDEEENGEIQKAVEDKFNEHRNSNVYTAVDDEEEEKDYDQSLNPFSDSFKASSKKE